MSYYQPYPPTHNVSFSRFSNSLPPRYIHDLPEYPPPPLYYEHPYRPSNTYLTKYNHSLEPTRVISNPNRSINQPIIQQENEDSTHGNFFRDRPRIHNTDFEIFINAMKEQIILLRDAEKIKEKLAFTEDFNIDLIYKKFDDNNNDNVSLKEFKQTLNNLGVPASEKESYLVIRQYSGNDRLTSKEFELLFLPKSGLMKNKLLQKDKNLDFIFKQETLELCKELLNVHLRLEACWEKFKQKLQLRKTNLKNLFKLVDVDQNDGMEASDLKQILEKNHMIPSIEEIEWVFHRFDDRNKKQIGFNEFLNELTRTPSPPVIPQLQKFIEIIQKQMEIEKKIEQKKADLIKMREFDFEKVYRIFDDNNSGAISYQEFRVGLMESFEVKNVQEEDLMQLFQTYNINDDGKLAKIELKKMIYPSDTQLFQKLVFQPGALSVFSIFFYRISFDNHFIF